MSSEVSIIVRARDMATRVLNGIGKNVNAFAKSAKRVLSFPGLAVAGFGIAGIARSMKELAKQARETGDYTIISKDNVRNVEGAAKFLGMMRDAASRIVASGIGALIGSEKLKELADVQQQLEESRLNRTSATESGLARVTSAHGAKAGLDYLDKLIAGETEVSRIKELQELRAKQVKEVEDQRVKTQKELVDRVKEEARARKELAAAQKQADESYVSSEQKISDLNYERLSNADKIAQKQAELSDAKAREGALQDPITRFGKEQLNNAVAKRMEIENELKALVDTGREQKRRALSEAVSRASSAIQSEGMAFFAGGRSRGISSANSAAMGARIRSLTGDDPTKFQRDTAFTLQQIYRLLGGGNSGR